MTARQYLLAHDSAGVAEIAEVVLLHAFPLDRRLWARMIEEPPEGARLTAFDMPGFGSSPVSALGPSGRFDLDVIAEAVARSLEELGIETAIFGGCSMGGFACLAMLRQHPEMVSGLLLADTRASADTPAARESRYAVISMIERDGIEGFAEAMTRGLLGPTTLDQRPEVVDEVREIILEQEPSTAITALRGLADRPDSTPLLANITVPASVVVGSEDARVPIEDARDLASRIPGCELVVIEGAGHLPPLESPSPFRAALSQLVERVGSA